MKRVPLQVYLDEALYKQLKAIAGFRQVSQSELVRRYLREGIAKDLGPRDPALDIIGLGDGKVTDLAANHDHYLAHPALHVVENKCARIAEQSGLRVKETLSG